MTDDVLTAGGILDTAEDVLRRFGPAKTTVVDVARALGVSHGSVYRHFPSKAALRDAVAERWLARVSEPLSRIVAAPGPAGARLRELVEQLSATKRRMALDDPELFATFHQIASESRQVVADHLTTLATHLATIIADGIACGEFAAVDAATAGRAVLLATARFHHPAHAQEWTEPRIAADLDAVMSLLINGLRASSPPGGPRQTKGRRLARAT